MTTIQSKPLRYSILIAETLIAAVAVILVSDAMTSDCGPHGTAKLVRDNLFAHKSNAEMRREARQAMRLLQVDGELQFWQTPIGRYWMNKPEADNFGLMIVEQQLDIYRLASLVHPGDVVLDCGANIGTVSRMALDRGAARVLAIEPDPYGVKCLNRNFAAEIAAGKVTVCPVGVSDSASWLYLDTEETHAVNASHGTKVPLVTIDSLIAESGLRRVDLIVMDIEGAEKSALRGAAETLRRFHPRLSIATEHKPDDFSAIPALVSSINPAYKAECGPCVAQFGRFQPFTMQIVAR